MNMIQGKALITTVIIMLLCAILLAVTNPKQENHVAAIHNSLAGRDAITNVINRGLLAVKPPAYHSLTLLSYTQWDNKISSIGVFGYVWVDVTTFK